MNTEITDNRANSAAGWIYYDAACAACVRGRTRTGRLFESRGFKWVPLQTPGAAARLGVTQRAFDIRMHLLTAEGRVLHNADALGLLCRRVWWLWPIGLALLVPGLRELGHVIYDWFARHRYRLGGACRVDLNPSGRLERIDWAVALLLPAVAALGCWTQPRWVLMWAVAIGLGLGLKWLTWRDAIAHGACPSARRAFVWFILWPGMDSRIFFGNKSAERAGPREWIQAAATTGAGLMAIWIIVPALLANYPTLAAWTGMIGIVLLLHFGLIRLLSILLRRFGVNAPPIMNAPFRATSLTQFWGERWNTAFSVPARRLMLFPVARKIGLPAAGFLVFLVSGLLHELVISLPARAGFGLPTLYFTVQSIGIAIERSPFGRHLGLGTGFVGWLFMALFTIGPLYWLFHPAFARDVIVPFLKFLTHH